MSQQINLFNPAFLQRKPRFTAFAILQGLALLLAGSLAMYAYELRQNRNLQSVLAESDRQLVLRRNELQQFTKKIAEQRQGGTLVQEIARAEERLRQRQHVLAEIESAGGAVAQGFSPFLVALARQRPDGMWLTGLTIGGGASDVVIKGRALDGSLVPAYIRALNREPSLSGRSVAELKLAAQDTKAASTPAPAAAGAVKQPAWFVEFSVSLRSRPAAPAMIEADRKGAS